MNFQNLELENLSFFSKLMSTLNKMSIVNLRHCGWCSSGFIDFFMTHWSPALFPGHNYLYSPDFRSSDSPNLGTDLLLLELMDTSWKEFVSYAWFL